MSTALSSLTNFRLHPEVETHCAITVVYQDTPARERAIWLCHHLVREFWAEIDFKFSWWRFKYLAEPGIAEAAMEAASSSDMIIVSTDASSALPPEVRGWFGSWTSTRLVRDAALVVLTNSKSELEFSRSPSAAFLREAADRAGMDCLVPLGQATPFVPRASVRPLGDRATQVTEVLDEILRHVGPPPALRHWGLNE
jgi:hypothetical protein